MGGGGAATDGILGGRQATTMLTRATWTTGSVFMALALILSIMSSRAQLPESILRQDVAPVVPTAQPILPSSTRAVTPVTDPKQPPIRRPRKRATTDRSPVRCPSFCTAVARALGPSPSLLSKV